MGRKEKSTHGGSTCISTFGFLLRRLRNEQGFSLLEMALLTGFSSSHLSNVEIGRTKPSQELLKKYEEHLKLKRNEIGAYFLLFQTKTIPVEIVLKDISNVDLRNALEIADVLDDLPLILELVAMFINKVGCDLSFYLKAYQPQVSDMLNMQKRSNKKSVILFKLKILLEDLYQTKR